MSRAASLALFAAVVTAPAGAQTVPEPAKTMMWLHGSSEAAALQRMTLRAMARHAIDAAVRRSWGEPADSVILSKGATIDAPVWTACTKDQPTAVILDIDETSILNTGWNYDTARRGDPAFDQAAKLRWFDWERTGTEKVTPMPGAVEAITAMRAAGIRIVFISNRDHFETKDGKTTDIANYTIAALKFAGLGDAAPGDTLFLKGDVAPGSDKDPRRAHVAERDCVVAMAGDQFGDFNEAFNPDPKTVPVAVRRAMASSAAVTEKLGNGWFLLPNPVYGPGVAGSYTDLFGDVRWPDPAPEKAERK